MIFRVFHLVKGQPYEETVKEQVLRSQLGRL